MPLSMTTAGREVGSMRNRKQDAMISVVAIAITATVVDLRSRSKRDSKARDHGREGRLEKRIYGE